MELYFSTTCVEFSAVVGFSINRNLPTKSQIEQSGKVLLDSSEGPSTLMDQD